MFLYRKNGWDIMMQVSNGRCTKSKCIDGYLNEQKLVTMKGLRRKFILSFSHCMDIIHDK